jgi:hypothetical protein
MPKFIKSNTIIEVNRHGIETDRQVLFTEDEIISRVLLNPSLLVEVTESHAANVIRVQQKYQEINEDTLEEIDRQRTEGEERIDNRGAKQEVEPHADEVEGAGDPEPEAEVLTELEADEDDAPLTFGS